MTARTTVFASALLLLMAAGLFFAYFRGSAMAAEMECSNNIKTIGLAMYNYHDVYGVYPSPDSGGHSWRIRSLPYIMASPMYEEYRYDEPWDSPSNFTIDTRQIPSKNFAVGPDRKQMHTAVHGMPYAYSCPSKDALHRTSYLMFVGDNAFGKPDGWRRRDEITDGFASTLVAGETLRANFHWLEPVDFDTSTMSYSVNDGPNSISSQHPRGPAVLFCDGSVYRLNPEIPEDTLRSLITINGGEDVDIRGLLRSGMLIEP